MQDQTEDEQKLNQQLALAMWYKQLKDTTNESFFPLFWNQSRYLVLKGGGGSGKSIFAGRKILERVTSEPGHRVLVLRKTKESIRDTCFFQLCEQAKTFYPSFIKTIPSVHSRSSELYISFKNGSEILFYGLDDVEKLKSIAGISMIWVEEASEILDTDYKQLKIRLRDPFPYYKQMILSFNPISITHWLKKEFFDKQRPNVTVHESTYKDNRFLKEEERQELESFKDTDEYHYTVYCLGNWGITGKTVFNGKDLMQRYNNAPNPLHVGQFIIDYDQQIKGYYFSDNDDGVITIYKEPEPNKPYVIGGDTAGEGSDSCTLQVLDNTTGDQVAMLKGADIAEDVYAHQTYCLGMYYNAALIALETNFSTYPTRELERLKYPHQYVRETIDNFTHQPRLSYGFQTNSKTRPIIISNLVQVVRDDINIINDRPTLEEMMTFIRNPDSYKPEAEDGAHDDLVMALAIAHHVRNSGQQSYTSAKPEKRTKWTKDMWEDYQNANAKDKEMLIEKWGKPLR